MPDATITSTASTFGTISGTFAADQSTITGTITGVVSGTLSGSVGVPGPQGPAGPGSTWGGIAGVLSNQLDLQGALDLKYNASNPAGYQTAAQVSTALAPYLSSATASATYQTLSGMSSYLTTSAAAAGYYPLSGNPSGFLTAASLSGYATESWVTGQGYITSAALSPYLLSSTAASTYYPLTGNPSGFLTSSALTPYLTKADNLASLTNFATARDNLGLGSLSSPTFAGITAQGSGANVANLTPTSLSLTHATSGSFVIQPSVGITFPDASVQTTAFTTSQLTAYLAKASNLSDLASTSTARTNLGLGSLAVINDAPSDGSQYARKNGAWDVVTATSSYISSVSSPLSVTSGNLTIDLSAYAPLASPVFTGDARAVTPAFGDNDTSISTTAFVQAALAGGTAVARNLEVEVRNQSGSTIAAGSIVYISGATGNKPLVTLAQANNDANSAQTIGFVKTSIANNGTGYVIVRGELENIDTSALTEGVQLYLSPTTAGTWTTTKPSAPQHMVYVGVVIRSHPTLGTILVAVMNGLELEELHNVAALTPANNDLLAYESSTDLWKNKTYSALGLLTSADAASTYVAKSGSAMTGGLTMGVGGYIGSFSMLSGNSIVIPDGGLEIYETALQNKGLLVRDSANVPLARFQADEVLIPSVGLTFSDASVQTSAGITAATAASTYQTISGMSAYAPKASPALTGNVTITSNSTGAALFIEQAGTGNILTLHDQASDTTFVAIDQNGKVNTIPSDATIGAGFNIPHGTAPTTPVNGDIWTTTSGLLARINGATRQYVDLDGTQTINGAKTFSNASQTLGNSTTAGTINIGTGAVTTGAKIINIGTGSTGGSVVITFGTAAMTGNTVFNGGGQFQVNNNIVNIGTNSAASSATFAGGATISGSTKTVAIGTGGVAGSTTNINLGTVDGGAATVTTNALLVTRASATTGSGLRVPHGAAPTSPTNGDIWTETTGVFARINGATQNLVPPALATLSEARQFTNDTKVMSPRDVLWSMLSQDFVDISGPDMTVTNTGTITSVQVGQLSRSIRPGNAGACSSRIRTFGISQVDQTWTATSRAQPSSFLNFSLRSIHSGRSTTSGVTDANYTCAVYYGKAEADGVGDLTRRGYGWKMVGGAGSRFLQLQAHNGTTLSSVTSSFAVTAGVAFDWDIESDGAGNVTLYVNGSSVATSTGGPTGSVNLTAVAWQEEVVAAAALSSPFMDFTNSRGRFIVINTW